MPKYITIGIKHTDGTAVILKQPSVLLSEQRAYIDSIMEYDPTYKAMYIFDLDAADKKCVFASEIALTVTANNKSVTYGDSKPSFTSTYSVTPTE